MKTKQLYRILFFLILFPFLTYSQTNFHQYFENPVVKGTPNSWDSFSIFTSSVVYDGEKYHMYYTANNSLTYSLFDMDIGYASSEDGYVWKKEFNEPIFKHKALGWEKDGYISPIVLKLEDKWHMWYFVLSREEEDIASKYPLGYATSKDGINWDRFGEEKYGEPLDFKVSDEGWDCAFVAPSDVIYDGTKYLMYYTGRDSLGTSAIGVAESDDGIHWNKDTFNNPVITWDAKSDINKYPYSCNVTFEENNPEYAYEMWYIANGDASGDRIFYAKSKDGKNWLKEENPILSCEESLWSRHYYEDVEVVKNGKRYQMWVNGMGEHWNKNASFGYFEDFSNCMHCDNVVCNTKFDSNGRPPEEFTAHLCNRDCDKFQVWARIECDDTKHSELYRMVQSDQSNAEFAVEEPVRCNKEGFFTFSTFLKNIQTDEIVFDSRNFDIVSKYTTAGPVKAIDYDLELISSVAHETDKYVIKNIELQNFSSEAKVNQLMVNLVAKNGEEATILNSGIVFGNLNHGESRLRESGIAFEVNQNISEPNLVLEISSKNTVYWSQAIVFDPVGVEEAENIPTEFVLSQNYPNPFNPSTTIKYSIPYSVMLNSFQYLDDKTPKQVRSDNVKVTLKVYDVLGKELATLVNEKQKSGYYKLEWNATNQPSGVYFYQLIVGASTGSATDFVETKKMILLR